MDKFEYKNNVYYRSNGIWCDSHYMRVCKALQSELNENYVEDINLDEMDIDELMSLADEYKNAERWEKALEVYKKILDLKDFESTRMVSSKITSCYRNMHKSEEAINFYNWLKKKYGDAMTTSILLTSVAEAYMDIGEYFEAQKLAKRAYAIANGKASLELKNVFNRLNKYFN